MNPKVSIFADVRDTHPKHIGLSEVMEGIKNGRWHTQIQETRRLFFAWKAVCPSVDSKDSAEAQAYDAYKRTLPAFCVSGTAKDRKEPMEHSGLLQIDCDKVGSDLDALRQKLKEDKHVAFGFVSPSGNGLKLGLAVDGGRHTESFEAAERYFREHYNVQIDPKVKDRLRLCFVSHDPNLWTNPDAVPLPIPDSLAHNATLSVIVLPSGDVSISASAREIFQRVAPTETLFYRGGAIVEEVEQDGVASLTVVKPEAFRSRIERHGTLMAWRKDGEGDPVLKPTKMPRDDAAALMETMEARELLPHVASVLRCPVLMESGETSVTILGQGYHPEHGGLLIVAGDEPPRVELTETVMGRSKGTGSGRN
jgi:hypothetical protein